MINITNLQKIIKKMTTSIYYIVIQPDRIIGLSSYNSAIGEIELDTNLLLKSDNEDIPLEMFPIITTIDELKYLSNSCLIDENGFIAVRFLGYTTIDRISVYNHVMRIYNILKPNQNYMNILSFENIKNNETIVNMISNTADAGAYYINFFNKYFLTIFKSLLPINKTDGLLLSLYDYIPNYQNMFIAEFVIEKKEYNVHLYIPYLKI